MEVTQFFVSQREEAFLGGDYGDYRAQNTRRLHNLRRRLGVATPKGRKYTAKPPVTADDVLKNPQYAQLLLLDAERSWATALSMKARRVEDSADQAITGATRQQIISKLNKASNHAGSLVKVLQDCSAKVPDGAQALLEAQAYQSYLRGSLYFEKGSWELCLKSLSVARIIYEALAAKTKNDIFRDLLSGTVDPSIRYAAYQSKLPRTKPVSQVAMEYFPQDQSDIRKAVEEAQPEAFNPQEKIDAEGRTSDRTAASKITWRTRTVNVEDATISEAIVAAEAAESQLVESDKGVEQDRLIALYDNIINARQEVVDAVKTSIDEMTKEGVDQGDSRMQALQITRTAVNYALIEWRVGRDRVLCGINDGIDGPAKQKKSSKAPTLTMASLRKTVALYDAILQSLAAIGNLPGVAADAELVQDLAGKTAYFRAVRCLAIGRSHSTQTHLENALALFNRAHELSSTAVSSITSVSDNISRIAPKLDISKSQLQDFNTYLKNLVIQYRALCHLHQLSSDASKNRTASSTPLSHNLNEYPEGPIDLTNLVVYPPKIQPIPVKPLFFDLAWNYIDYPGRTPAAIADGGAADEEDTDMTEAPAAKEKGQQQQPAKKGWFGFGRG